MSDSFSRYDVYSIVGSRYCYQNTNVLRNRFGIRDGNVLRMIEADISAARQSEMLETPVSGRFTQNHLRRIHRRLLGDVYFFAGSFRREDIAKGSTRFLTHNEISTQLEKVLSQLRQENFLTELDYDTLVKRSAWYMAELNYIHPFREGNGRVIREFMRLLYLQNGYHVRWDAVEVEDLLQAMIDSVFDTGHLEEVLAQCLKKMN